MENAFFLKVDAFYEGTLDILSRITEYHDLAFEEDPALSWSEKSLIKHIGEGWVLYTLNVDEEIIAVIFCKKKT